MEQRDIEIPVQALDLIVHMVAVDPKERYTVEDIAAHPWM
jgi:serine/threonine protein kinase